MRKLLCVLLLIANGMVSAADISGSYFAVIVNDIEVSKTWYCDTLKLTEAARRSVEGRFDIVNLARPGLFVELLEMDAAGPKPDGRNEGPFKVGMLVRDIDDFVASLPDNVEIPNILDDEENRLRLVQLRDPDGNTVQVMQQLNE